MPYLLVNNFFKGGPHYGSTARRFRVQGSVYTDGDGHAVEATGAACMSPVRQAVATLASTNEDPFASRLTDVFRVLREAVVTLRLVRFGRHVMTGYRHGDEFAASDGKRSHDLAERVIMA